MILVRNQIRAMLGGETGKITLGKLNINLGLRGKLIPSWYNILGGCGLQCCCFVLFCCVVVVKFMTVSRGVIRPNLSLGFRPYRRSDTL